MQSIIEQRVHEVWPEQLDEPKCEPFRASWQGRLGESLPPTLSAWVQWMNAQPERELDVLACVRDAAVEAGETHSRLHPEFAQMVVAMLLFAAARHIQLQAAAEVAQKGAVQWAAQRLAAIDERLAAQLVAACISGRGLLLLASSDGDVPEAQAMSVIEGLPPEVLLQRDGRDAVRLEVDAHLAALRQPASAGGLRQRQADARGKRLGGAPRTDAAVKRDVEAFQKRWNSGLMFVVPAADSPEPLRDPLVCQYAQEQLGVPVYLYGAERRGEGATAAAATGDPWAGIVANVADPLREAIAALFPGSPVAAGGGMAGVPQVFLSYAHDPADAELVAKVRKRLEILDKNGHIRLWVDVRGIRTGEDFHPEIKAGIDAARIAVVLVSNALLLSDYVRDHELPRILERRAAGLTFCPLLLESCHLTAVPHFAETNFKFGVEPLQEMTSPQQAHHLTRLSEWMLDHLAGRQL